MAQVSSEFEKYYLEKNCVNFERDFFIYYIFIGQFLAAISGNTPVSGGVNVNIDSISSCVEFTTRWKTPCWSCPQQTCHFPPYVGWQPTFKIPCCLKGAALPLATPHQTAISLTQEQFHQSPPCLDNTLLFSFKPFHQ